MTQYTWRKLKELNKKYKKPVPGEKRRKLIIVIQGLLAIYFLTLFVWAFLTWACVMESSVESQGYFIDSCGDNVLTEVVKITHKPFYNFLVQ